MTSVLRGFRDVRTQITKFSTILTPSYFDDIVVNPSTSSGADVPIPFIVTDGVLDINIQDNVQVDCIDSGAFPFENGGDDWPDFQVRQLGNLQNVTSLGPKFIEWMRNVITWIEDDGDYTGPVTLVVKPVMIDVQYTTDNQGNDRSNNENTLGNEVVFANSLSAPSGDNYITGTPSNNYRRVSVFKTPITISYDSTDLSPGQKRYITLNTLFDGN